MKRINANHLLTALQSLLLAGAAVCSGGAHASSEAALPYSFEPETGNVASQQRGARKAQGRLADARASYQAGLNLLIPSSLKAILAADLAYVCLLDGYMTEAEEVARWYVTDPAVAALRHRDFRIFYSGQILSLVGTWMQSTAQGWLVLDLTDSALLLGVVLGTVADALGGDPDTDPNWLMTALDTIGTSYVSLLKAAVVPLIVTAVISSIANLRDVTGAARLAWKTLAWFAIAAGDPTKGALPIFFFPPADLMMGVVFALLLGLVAIMGATLTGARRKV